MILKQILVAILAVSLISAVGSASVIDDFSGGVTAANHPEGAGVYGTWYDITSDAFATPSAGTLDGSAALKIDDGGFTNGVYAIYQSAIPADGIYTVSADMHVNEASGVFNSIRAYQLGIIVNGTHRGLNPSDLATVAGPGTAVGNYVGLTTEDDNGLPTQLVTTGMFSASAGDDLLIAFSTDLDTGNFDEFSATWSGSHVLVDNISLNLIPEPSTFVLFSLGGLLVVCATRRN